MTMPALFCYSAYLMGEKIIFQIGKMFEYFNFKFYHIFGSNIIFAARLLGIKVLLSEMKWVRI